MPTVKELKSKIKVKCPAISKMKKVQLVQTAKNLGIKVEAKKKKKGKKKQPKFWDRLQQRREPARESSLIDEYKAIEQARALGRSIYSLKDRGLQAFQTHDDDAPVTVLIARRKK